MSHKNQQKMDKISPNFIFIFNIRKSVSPQSLLSHDKNFKLKKNILRLHQINIK
jgi:hypothetical protein